MTPTNNLKLSTKSAAPLRGAIAVALLFALAGALFGFRTLALATLPHILMPDNTRTFQEVSDPLPVPRVLDWNLTLIQLMESVSALQGPLLALLGILIVVVAVAVSQSQLAHSVETPPLKIVDEEIIPPRSAAVSIRFRKDVFIRSGVLILAISLLVRFAHPEIPPSLLPFYHTLGTFHQGYWLEIASHYLGMMALIWGGGGFIAALALKQDIGLKRRAFLLLAPVTAFALAFFIQKPLHPSYYSVSRDWTPAVLATAPEYNPKRDAMNEDTTMVGGVPDSTNAGKEFANRTGLKQVTLSQLRNRDTSGFQEKSAILFFPEQLVNVRMRGYTEDGLGMSADSGKAANDFLKKKNHESALSWIALKHMYNLATTNFDLTAATQVCIDDMKTNPHLAQCNQTVRNSLFIASASKANKALLDQWADEKFFTFPTRISRRQMGDLYIHFGDKERALQWYAKADMPKTFMETIRTEKPLFCAGKVTGILTLNGKPLIGAKVGVFPKRLNALPKDLELNVLSAGKELVANFFPSMLFPLFNPRPFVFRWVTAGTITDSQGRFELNDLTEGEYTLISAMPNSIKFQPPLDPNLSVVNSPKQILVNYRHPQRDLGTIAMKFSDSSSPVLEPIKK